MALQVLLSIAFSTTVKYLSTAVLAYLCSLAIYRVYFHPLSHIPGPKAAAISYFYELYWDVIKPGRLTWHLVDLHKRYGPILRITPDEVHIIDSSYYDELYARSTGRRHKLPRFSGRFGFKTDCFSTWQHETHRMRRAAINPFFSAKKVTDLQPIIRSNLAKLAQSLVRTSESKDIIPINLAYMALTGDITTTYAFDRSYNQLDSPGFQTTYDECLKALYTLGNLTVHFPIIFTLIDASPPWLTQILNPTVMPIVKFYADCEREINHIRTTIDKAANPTSTPKPAPSPSTLKTPTIFHELLLTPTLPPHEKTDARLGAEAVEIVAAGIITTSFALTVGTFHILTNPTVLSALRAELSAHLPTAPHPSDFSVKALDWHTLEALPYLSGCVRESIRLSGGVVTRAPRINPDGPTTYASHTIPAGYAVSMTSWHLSHDTALFPGPESFEPTRWLKTDAASGALVKNTDMERWLVAFGKGARQCAGINLAFAELYVTLAVVFRCFELEVVDTMYERDVRVSHAYMVPYPSMASKGVKVRVLGLRD